MVKTETVPIYSYKITGKKFLYSYLFALAPVILIFTANFIQDNSAEFPVEFAVIIPLVAGILTAIANYIKHKDDTEEVPIE